ncbi:hypothetical protein ACFV4K_26275, partial [Nocardia sp. NPDC059764]|uniref:hypothetical protein n=1 Tax=Nocardia sp. NPDC059764 TaxID=3346939 RepID=UPI00364F35C0
MPEHFSLPENAASPAIPASPALPAVTASPDIPVEAPVERQLSRAERRGKGARKQHDRDGKVHDPGRASV